MTRLQTKNALAQLVFDGRLFSVHVVPQVLVATETLRGRKRAAATFHLAAIGLLFSVKSHVDFYRSDMCGESTQVALRLVCLLAVLECTFIGFCCVVCEFVTFQRTPVGATLPAAGK